MPEGAEVSHSRDQLRRLLLNKQIVNAFSSETGRYARNNPTGFDEFIKSLGTLGAYIIQSIDVKGKFMWWTLKRTHDEDVWYVWITYGMSGQFSRDKTQHTAFGFYCNDSGLGVDQFDTVYFNDPRRFGTIKFVHSAAAHAKKLASLGPDMLNDPPDAKTFRQALLRKHSWTLAATLMNQSVVSGVGNYVKAEALYAARLSPHDVVHDLSSTEIECLRCAIIDVLQRSYELHGASMLTYREVGGQKGEASSRFAVYGKPVDPLGNPVVRELTADNRTTHWVPNVQNRRTQ